MSKTTGFREISHLLTESRLVATGDSGLFTSDHGNADNKLFDSTNTSERTFENNNDVFTLTYTFTGEGKRPINKIIVNMGTNTCAILQVKVSENGTDFETMGISANNVNTSTIINDVGAKTLQQDGSSISSGTDVVFTFDQFTTPPETGGLGFGSKNNEGKIRFYKAFQIRFVSTFSNGTDTRINYIQVFEEFAYNFPKTYNVEFNDSVLDTAGWKNARYEGSKLISQDINFFTSRNETWPGDVSYGKNPVIERKMAALMFGTSIIGGDSGKDTAEEEAYVRLIGHSYVSIDKILLIDLLTDKITIIDRQNTPPAAFKKFVDDNLTEGSTCKLRILDNAINHSLKQEYFVKFNRGSLQKIYKYTANEEGFEDGVFGGHEVRSNTNNQFVNTLEGQGLFGFGMTAVASRSLFTTSSISFVEILPAELSEYAGDVNTSTLGIDLAPITASFVTLPIGTALDDSFDFTEDSGFK